MVCLPSSRDMWCRALSKYFAARLFEFHVATECVMCLAVACSNVVLVRSVTHCVVLLSLLGSSVGPFALGIGSGGLPGVVLLSVSCESLLGLFVACVKTVGLRLWLGKLLSMFLLGSWYVPV